MINKLMFNGKLASISTLFLVLGLNVAITNKTQALELTLSPVNLGWIGENGLHFQVNTNYFAGDCRGEIGQCDPATDTNIQFNPGTEIRNFFVFDTTGYSFTNINSAKLVLQLPEFEVLNNVDPINYPVGSTVSGFVSDSVPPEESFQLYDVNSSNVALLDLGHTEGSLVGQNLFNDLGTGLSLSDMIVINNTSGGNFVDINLNPTGISQILGGGKFAFGGTITTLDGIANDEFAFGYSNPSFNQLNPNAVDTVRRVRLVLDVSNQSQSTPEPSALIGLIGLGGLGLFGRKKGKKSSN